jgi:DNA polymerase (family X)
MNVLTKATKVQAFGKPETPGDAEQAAVPLVNVSVADRLDEVAQILEEQRANVFRVGAYRRAAAMLRGLTQPIDQIVKTEGVEGLQKLPGIGETLARFIHQLVMTGRLPMLDRLRGESDPIALLRTVPGIGKVMAERLHDQLGIEGLEELEIAAHDGRLAGITGLGSKRIAGIRDSLAARLGRVRIQRTYWQANRPPVSEVLDVDAEYRRRAASGELPKIAPRRFNPGHRRWLPILHTVRNERHYTAVFSNTPRAHQLHRTSDWVVIYYDGTGGERQCTVITSTYGPFSGRRIIRGREPECMEHYLHPIPAGIRGKIHNGFSL